VATFKNGTKKFEVMTIDDIERVKNTSRSKNFGPWVDHYEAMAKKSVIRKLAKFLPLSPEFAQVQALDNDEPQENWRIVEPDYVPEKTVEPTLLAEANKEADAEKVLELKKRVLAVLEKLEAKFPNDWMERLKVTGAPDIDKMTEPELTKLGVLCASLLK
jgi:recombination protein RecT